MEKRLKILVTNDDGISAEGIMRLARMAGKLGDVWVVAPSSQCSAMSQRLTIFNTIPVAEYDFPVPVKAAYSIGGTPADCVMLAMEALLLEKPDYVFSGINFGYNAGFDIAYSGTLGAAKEAVMHGVPAIAFSMQHDGGYEVAEEYMLPLAQELIAAGQAPGEIWNINFPGCSLGELKGIKRERCIAQSLNYTNHYVKVELDGGYGYEVHSELVDRKNLHPDSDIRAVLDGYIAVGKVRSEVM